LWRLNGTQNFNDHCRGWYLVTFNKIFIFIAVFPFFSFFFIEYYVVSGSKRLLKGCAVNGTLKWKTHRADLLPRYFSIAFFCSLRNVRSTLALILSECASDRQPITHRHGIIVIIIIIIIIICTAQSYRRFDLQLFRPVDELANGLLLSAAIVSRDP
jgi:hypothetical protein